MPINIPDSLPAVEVLTGENIFVMTETRARTQDIRPLKIALLNLMPIRSLLNTVAEANRQRPYRWMLRLSICNLSSVLPGHLLKFYNTFNESGT